MDLKEEIIYQIGLLNEVLEFVGEPTLFKNSSFVINEISHSMYLKIYFVKTNNIEIILMFALDGIQISIDRIDEAYEMDMQKIYENPFELKSFLAMLFTSKILVKYCGKNYTKLYFYDSNGNRIKSITSINGFYHKLNCNEICYEPIYTVI